MKVDVRLIKDEEFLSLAIMYVKMNEPVAAAPALYSLTHDLTAKDFTAIGLYENDVLSGFVTGYALSHKTFYFSGIYVKVKNKNVGKLIDYSIKYAKELGYKSCEANCTNSNIQSILIKKGAYVMYTRVKREC